MRDDQATELLKELQETNRILGVIAEQLTLVEMVPKLKGLKNHDCDRCWDTGWQAAIPGNGFCHCKAGIKLAKKLKTNKS